MWYSACNELLQFVFGMSGFVCLIYFLETKTRRRWSIYILGIIGFSLCLLSKESGVIFFPLYALLFLERRASFNDWLSLLPFAFLTTADALLIFQQRRTSFRFGDGSFELSAPFWITWTKSFFSLFWFWGLLAVLLLIKYRQNFRLIAYSFISIGISLILYMFLTYQSRIPSRQTYLPSLGVALIVGAALAYLWKPLLESRRKFAAAIILVIVLHNVVYLWTKKRQEFLARAAPTEQLIDFARSNQGQFAVKCFPRGTLVADTAIEVGLGRPVGTIIWDEKEIHPDTPTLNFCEEKSN